MRVISLLLAGLGALALGVVATVRTADRSHVQTSTAMAAREGGIAATAKPGDCLIDIMHDGGHARLLPCADPDARYVVVAAIHHSPMRGFEQACDKYAPAEHVLVLTKSNDAVGTVLCLRAKPPR